MHLPPGCWTDPGRRSMNQDAAVREAIGDDAEVAAVADGMGGHAAGEIASREALQALVAALKRGDGLRQAVRAANETVYNLAQRSPELQGMGTTLVAYLRRGESYEIANVGDSRAYLLEGEEVTRITRDHSFVAEAVASGRLTEEEAQRSRWRNALTRAVGTEPEVEPDIYGPFTTEHPHTLLLCTDGLHRWLEEAELPMLVAAEPEVEAAAAALGRTALQRGGDDNITVLLVEVGQQAKARQLAASEVAVVEVEPALPPKLDAAGRVLRPPGPLGLISRPDTFQSLLPGGTPDQLRALRRFWRRWRRLEPFVFVLALVGVLIGLVALVLRSK